MHITLPLFIDTPECRHGVACALCRSPGRGAAWRIEQERKFSPPDRWECPKGKPWAELVIPTPPRGAPANSPPEKSPAPQKPGPGDVVKLVLGKLGIKAGSNCGCEAFRRQMNAWGWGGCITHRAEILAWFRAKAAEQGMGVDAVTLFKLLLGAWREMRTREQPSEHDAKPREA